ncbi:hypothetical protein GUJ93_ZPchr0004g40423 [Zizania palustris]|uniref:Uncharacterized protein n=1 Tax=Zizania palustris TaxID=103762 RepID=A0A8J5T1P6_ZIZPA|nr:hypothetical protein GUJ93_ZPchr0004g40423 [Zizania palustris]
MDSAAAGHARAHAARGNHSESGTPLLCSCSGRHRLGCRAIHGPTCQARPLDGWTRPISPRRRLLVGMVHGTHEGGSKESRFLSKEAADSWRKLTVHIYLEGVSRKAVVHVLHISRSLWGKLLYGGRFTAEPDHKHGQDSKCDIGY